MSVNAGESGTDTGRMPERKPAKPEQDQKYMGELEKEKGAGVQVSKEQSQQPIKTPDKQ